MSPRNEVARYSLAEYLTQIANGGYGSFYPSSYTVGGKPAEKIPNSYTSYAQSAYGSSSVVGACMRVRRDLVSQARFAWRELTEDGTGKLKHDDGLAVLDRPWPNGTTGELVAKMITDVDLCGNAFVVNDGDRLRWRRPDWMYIVLSGDPQVDYDVDVVGYVYTPGGAGIEGGKPYLVDEVCHWSPIPMPGAEYVGMSWMMSALRDIQGDLAATEHKLSFFENGTQLGPIYTLPATLTAEQFKKFREGNELAHAGSRNAYKAQYIGGGATVTLAASTFQQLELKATVGANETRIAALAGTHPSIVGLSEGLQGASLNAGNFTAARRLVADITLMRLWQDLCASLQTFVDPPDGYELWIRERAIPFLREDAKDAADIFATEMETVTKGVREGFTPDSAKAATQQRNVLLLEHSGLMSVQLQPPGSGVPGEVPGEVPTEEAPIDFGALRSDARSDRDDDIARALTRAIEEIERKFNPGQPRDYHGRWSLSGAVIAALKAQGGEQGGAYFGGGQYFDWSSFDPETATYQFEVGADVNDVDAGSARFEVSDYDLEQLFNALTVTRLRDRGAHSDTADTQAVALAALGHADHLILDEDSHIDWSSRGENGNYRFEVASEQGDAEFDLTPAEMDKLIASLALSTQTKESVRAFLGLDTDEEIERSRYGEGAGERVGAGFEGGGRFRSLTDRLTALLTDWVKGEGPDDPLDEFNREQLRKTAKGLADKAAAAGDHDRAARLTPRRGASSDEIKLALYKDMRSRRDAPAGKPEAPKPTPRKAAPTAPKSDLPDDPEALRDALDLHKVPELKDMLRERGLPVSGRKRELVDRLVEHQATDGRAPVKAAKVDPQDKVRADVADQVQHFLRLIRDGVDPHDRETTPKLDRIAAGLTDGSLSDADASAQLATLADEYAGSASGDNLRNWSRALAPDVGPEQKSRARQAEIDKVRGVAEVAAEVHELIGNETDPDAMRRSLKAIGQRHGVDTAHLQDLADDPAKLRDAADEMAKAAKLTRIGSAGEPVSFDRKQHEGIAGPLRDGQSVEVVRPGYSARLADGEQVQISKARVEVTVPAKAAPSKATSSATLDLEGRGPSGLSTDPAVREVQIENRIRAAYRDLVRNPRDHIMLADLRDRTPDVSRAEFDAALVRMSTEGGQFSTVHLAPEEDRRRLTPRLRNASIRHGDDNMHTVSFEDPSPRPPPTPTKAVKKAAPSKRTPTKATPDDGLDGMSDHSLGSLAAEFDMPKASEKTRAQHLAYLRRQGAVSPAVRQARLDAEDRNVGPVHPVGATTPLSSHPLTRATQIQNRIRTAYVQVLKEHGREDGGWVTLAELRDQLGTEVSRDELDNALRIANRMRGTRIVPESNQKTLTDREEAAHLIVGRQRKHLIAIKDPAPMSSSEFADEVRKVTEPSAARPVEPTKPPAFVRRAGAALADDEAVRAVAHEPSSDAVRAAIDSYGGEGTASYQQVNDALRGGRAYGVTSHTPEQRAVVDGLDRAMREAPGTPRDLVTYRFVTPETFGEGLTHEQLAQGDMTGLEWRDGAFVSTGASSEWASQTSEIAMRILVPNGTKAISHSRRTADGGGLDLDEILLDRGLRFRVVADHGYRRRRLDGTPDPYSGRDLDVEVLID